MSAYDNLCTARAKGRPTAAAFIEKIFDGFIEFSGDRAFADDKAIIGGIAWLNDIPVTVIAIEKGTNTKEKIERNFGAASPEGYRKAIRLMEQAEKFKRPVICLVDTAGAYCGTGAEERGQGEAIAASITNMMSLKTPIISLLLSEGGSGGALALAVADEVWMLENAVYSVISPEGAASIIWKDSSKTKEAAESLKMTASDLLKMQVIERVFEEPKDFSEIYTILKDSFYDTLKRKQRLSTEKLLKQRYSRFRKLGGEAL